MIIGAITEVTESGSGFAERYHNGAAMVMFYTNEEAESWAVLQSANNIYGSDSRSIFCLCTVINTETDTKRWWFDGTEYTA